MRADNINDSCLFHQNSEAGKKIFAACRMGHSCEVKARVNDEASDVVNIVGVYSARPINK